ncbi:MAG: impB/mucB/samB family protein [Micavibrio sp.]
MNALHSAEESGLSTLYLDLNSFFASVEQNERPELRGRPVAVVPAMTDSTCAIAASYEAKAYGIRTGTKIYDAKRLCPGLICILASHNIYTDYHRRIMGAAEKHIPVTKIWSIDEFHCDLIGRERCPENARALALAIKEQIRKDIGPAVKCSIGVSSNSFLAKVATDLQKPDGLVLLHPDDLPGPLFSLKLTDLPGINLRMQERLLRAGICSIKDLWNTSPKQARAVWGSVTGEKFWYWLHGYDVPHTPTNASTIGHSRILDPALRIPDKARQITRRLLYKAVMRMRRKGFHAARLSFSVRLLDGRRWYGESDFPAAQDVFTFMQHFESLWADMTRQCFNKAPETIPQRMLFKKVSVTLTKLREDSKITDDLFETGLQGSRALLQKRNSLSAAMESLNNKYQGDAVTLGIIPKTEAGHVGTKIAFSRVPEKEEFWE